MMSQITQIIIQTTMIQTMVAKPIKYRHEFKHRITKLDDYDLSKRLGRLFKRDTNADSHGSYRVSSLYFDTPYDKAMKEKIDGVNKREKFRLRYYNDNVETIKLEKKAKHNNLSTKRSSTLTKEEVIKILNGDIDFLLQSENPLLVEFYSKIKTQLLTPKTVVVYDREAFIYEPGNCRITFDRNLKTSYSVHDFLNPDHFKYDISEAITILEVKYDQFLPDIVKIAIQLKDRPAGAFSKYAVSRKYD